MKSGSRAYNAGLRPDNIIQTVDGTEVTLSRFTAVSLQDKINNIPPGKKVKLGVFRFGDTSIVVELRGDTGGTTAPDYTLSWKDSTAVLVLAKFGDKTASSIATELKAAKNPTGIIVDLRTSPGGSFESLQKVIAQFLPQGTYYAESALCHGTLQKPVCADQTKLMTTGSPVAANWPIAVLLNPESEIGARLFAYAMWRSHSDAVIIRQNSNLRISGDGIFPGEKAGTGNWHVIYTKAESREAGVTPLTSDMIDDQAITKEARTANSDDAITLAISLLK